MAVAATGFRPHWRLGRSAGYLPFLCPAGRWNNVNLLSPGWGDFLSTCQRSPQTRGYLPVLAGNASRKALHREKKKGQNVSICHPIFRVELHAGRRPQAGKFGECASHLPCDPSLYALTMALGMIFLITLAELSTGIPRSLSP